MYGFYTSGKTMRKISEVIQLLRQTLFRTLTLKKMLVHVCTSYLSRLHQSSLLKLHNQGHTKLGKESKEMVEALWTHMEGEILDLAANPIETTILGKEVRIHAKIDATQFDNKCIKMLCGCLSAFCTVV